MKQKTKLVQFILVQNQQESHATELKQALEAKKRVIQVLMEMAFLEQQEKGVHELVRGNI